MTGYYDYVLGIIPLALIGITGALSLVGLELTTAVPLGAGVATLIVAHALFVNGPVDGTSGSGSASSPAPSQSQSPAPAASGKPVNAD